MPFIEERLAVGAQVVRTFAVLYRSPFAAVKHKYVQMQIRYKQKRFSGLIFDVTQEDIGANPRFTHKFWGCGSNLEESEYTCQLSKSSDYNITINYGMHYIVIVKNDISYLQKN